jgi:hypothetical protein
MNYWLSVFNEETWRQFRDMPSKVCAFPEPRMARFPNIPKDDRLICYISRKMVWAGVLRVSGDLYRDRTLIYEGGIFPIRIPVEPLIVLATDEALPMTDLEGHLSFFPKGSTGKRWAPYVRNSPKKIHSPDAETIISFIQNKVTKE